MEALVINFVYLVIGVVIGAALVYEVPRWRE
jgi:hypothetical protein